MKFIIGKDFAPKHVDVFAVNWGRQMKGEFYSNAYHFCLSRTQVFKFVYGDCVLYQETTLNGYDIVLTNRKICRQIRATCVIYPEWRFVRIVLGGDV